MLFCKACGNEIIEYDKFFTYKLCEKPKKKV